MSRYDTILTVGSTEFTPLVSAFLTPAALSALAANGSSSVLVQAGASTLPPPYRVGTHTHDSLTLEICKFLPDLEDRVGEATLVADLAEEMAAERWATVCTPSTLAETLTKLAKGDATATTTSAPPHDPSKLAAILDSTAGFS